jgi:hypothetical protein
MKSIALDESEDPICGDPHRPRLSVMTDENDSIGGSCVSLCVAPLWGQPARYADLTPAEARTLARMLCEHADEAEAAATAAA